MLDKLIADVAQKHNVTLSEVGLTIPPDTSFETYEKLADGLWAIRQGHRFWVGDLLNQAERDFQEGYTQLLSDTLGREMTTIENWRYTCRNVPIAVRRAGVAYSKHYEVACLQSHRLMAELLLIAEIDLLMTEQVRALAQHLKPYPLTEQNLWADTIHQNEWGYADLFRALHVHVENETPSKVTAEDDPADDDRVGHEQSDLANDDYNPLAYDENEQDPVIPEYLYQAAQVALDTFCAAETERLDDARKTLEDILDQIGEQKRLVAMAEDVLAGTAENVPDFTY